MLAAHILCSWTVYTKVRGGDYPMAKNKQNNIKAAQNQQNNAEFAQEQNVNATNKATQKANQNMNK